MTVFEWIPNILWPVICKQLLKEYNLLHLHQPISCHLPDSGQVYVISIKHFGVNC